VLLCVVVSQLKNPEGNDPAPSWDKLSDASGMAPNTIRDCYKQLLPYLATVSSGEHAGQSVTQHVTVNCPQVALTVLVQL